MCTILLCLFLSCETETNNEPEIRITTLFEDQGTSGSSVWFMDKWHQQYDYYIVHDCDSAVMQTLNTVYLPEIINPFTDCITLYFEYELYINSALEPTYHSGLSTDGENFSFVWNKYSEDEGIAEIDISGWSGQNVYLRFLAINLAPADGAILRSVKIEYTHAVQQ